MKTIYNFLFYLQKHPLFFHYQNAIFEILLDCPQNNFELILDRIRKLEINLVVHTQRLMEELPAPFCDSDIFQLRYGEEKYPREFVNLVDPPLVFSYLGSPVWLQEKIAIVGSRQPSQKSLWWMRKELKDILFKLSAVSVSGGAIGIDQWVHHASTELNQPTIAVLPSGLKNIYPKSFHSLIPKILADGGCLLSEFSDTEVVRKYHFSYRNRLIAALGKVSLIVEAKEKSGSLITAHRALEMGKDVFVVPGHPLDDSFKGSLNLLNLGARVIANSNDVIDWF
jgi:DNA processing protein